jgi:hypothetical protein
LEATSVKIHLTVIVLIVLSRREMQALDWAAIAAKWRARSESTSGFDRMVLDVTKIEAFRKHIGEFGKREEAYAFLAKVDPTWANKYLAGRDLRGKRRAMDNFIESARKRKSLASLSARRSTLPKQQTKRNTELRTGISAVHRREAEHTRKASAQTSKIAALEQDIDGIL